MTASYNNEIVVVDRDAGYHVRIYGMPTKGSKAIDITDTVEASERERLIKLFLTQEQSR